MIKRWIIVTIALICTTSAIAAPKAKKVPKDLKPVEMKLQWGTVKYSVDGGKMNTYKTLCPYLERLGDTEVSNLITKARKKGRAADVIGSIGGGAIVWGVCALWWAEDKEWNDPEIKWPIIIGAGLGAISSAFRTSADTNRFDAVQRFNSVVRGEQKISMDLRMKGATAMAGLRYRF